MTVYTSYGGSCAAGYYATAGTCTACAVANCKYCTVAGCLAAAGACATGFVLNA